MMLQSNIANIEYTSYKKITKIETTGQKYYAPLLHRAAIIKTVSVAVIGSAY